jgi:hypothetical protein
MGTTWSYLDLAPLGRQERWEDSPEGYPQTEPYKWWNWHDQYAAGKAPDPEWVKVSEEAEATFRNRPEEGRDNSDEGRGSSHCSPSLSGDGPKGPD